MKAITWVFALLLGAAFSVDGQTQPASSGTTVSRPRVGETFRDCPDCPELVVIPSGSFQMGSPSSERGRNDDEGPVHTVTIGYKLAVGKYPVMRGQWRAFVGATGYPGATCYGGGNWESPPYFREQNFSQDDAHPVVCVTWKDAMDYTQWLSQRTGHSYRLLSEAEYEYVNRAGSTTRYFWGDSEADLCRYANGGSTSVCKSDYAHTSPVGHFVPNRFGLYDTTGNVWEWTLDCYHGSYSGAPVDGSAWQSRDCTHRVDRGGSWYSYALSSSFRSAARSFGGATSDLVGLRVARTLP
jgi:formylglycine-generating enzyme required for sulfatase activity